MLWSRLSLKKKTTMKMRRLRGKEKGRGENQDMKGTSSNAHEAENAGVDTRMTMMMTKDARDDAVGTVMTMRTTMMTITMMTDAQDAVTVMKTKNLRRNHK